VSESEEKDSGSPDDPPLEEVDFAALAGGKVDASGVGFDPELDAALKKVLQVVYRDHKLSPNQILVLASELQRVGVHRLVEEHLKRFRRSQP